MIKPHFYTTLDDKKQIEVAGPSQSEQALQEMSAASAPSEEEQRELRQLLETKDQILRDAESVAEEQIRLAMEEASQLRANAQAEIDEWWHARRELDHQVETQARQDGFEAGFQEGVQHAQEQVAQDYAGMIAEAKTVLEQAYEMKNQIIKESEPFLVDLSIAIAEKIIQHELSSNPDWIIGITRSVLSRKREKGVISLCVAPEQFAYIRDARDELLLAVDSQAELQILPDSTVGSNGCVVRTDFGSVDARVDTQLKEIKLALQQLSLEQEGAEEE
ncbi:FliH/SctL family protein [Gorillibacterium sp. sgz5001074]|uniref:FliH/SctL family protein n=1 Tax=Gorillibacterium sp. sgz5001074 TaxID=3446695 RepID=UPI003F66C959